MPIKGGCIVLTPYAEKPYKVVLQHHPSGTSEHPVSTVREGEALIRGKLIFEDPQPQLVDWHI